MSLSEQALENLRSVPDDQRVMFIGLDGHTNVGHSHDEIMEAIWTGKTGNTVDLTKYPPYYGDSAFDKWTNFDVKIGNPLKLTHTPGGPDFDMAKHISKRMIEMSDISSQIAVKAGKGAVAMTGYWQDGKIIPNQKTGQEQRVGVVVGTSVGGTLGLLTYNRMYEEAKLAYEEGRIASDKRPIRHIATRLLPGQAAAFLGNELDAQGPRQVVSTECGTGGTALKDAIEMLTHHHGWAGRLKADDPRARDADLVIVGTTEVANRWMSFVTFNGILGVGALSTRNDDPSKASRPFDKDADGLVFGEGAQMFAMQTLDKVKQNGAEDRILGEVLSVAHVSDPKSGNPIFPSEWAIAQSMTESMYRGGVTPNDIDLIIGHATSTGNSEIVESAAIYSAMGSRAEVIPVISTKSVTGHPLASALTINVAVALEAGKRGEIPPNWNLFEVNPLVADINLLREHKKGPVEVVKINAQGFGGSNVSLDLIAGYIQ